MGFSTKLKSIPPPQVVSLMSLNRREIPLLLKNQDLQLDGQSTGAATSDGLDAFRSLVERLIR